MGRRYRFYIEGSSGAAWKNYKLDASQIAQMCIDKSHECYPHEFLNTQSFYAFNHWSYLESIFLGDKPLFIFERGLPEDISENLKRRITNDARADWWWIDFNELMIDSWEETWVLVSRSVPRDKALSFGDGSRKLSRKQLSAALNETELESYFPGIIIDTKKDYVANPKGLYIESRMNMLDATWKMTLAEYLPDNFVYALRVFSQISKTDQLRMFIVHEY